MFESLVKQTQTMVIYESPHKINKTINDCMGYFGEDKKVVICRELSKKFEEIIRGTLKEVSEIISKKTLKGEIVLVLSSEKTTTNESDQ